MQKWVNKAFSCAWVKGALGGLCCVGYASLAAAQALAPDSASIPSNTTNNTIPISTQGTSAMMADPVVHHAATDPVIQETATHIPAREISPYTWVIGTSVSNGPVFSGSDRRGNAIRPVLGFQYGRYTISSGGGGSLLDFDIDAADSGVSARLLDWDDFRMSATLRLDRGRKGGDDIVLGGLPDIDTTLRGRLSAVYDFSRWASVKVALNQDLLGKGGGSVISTAFRYEYQVTPATELLFVAGVDMASSAYMRSYYGVPQSSAGVTTNLPRFDPRAGVFNTAVGVELKTALTDNWVLSGGLSLSQLRGDARRSPLAIKPNNYSVYLGLAYRCCR